MEVIQVMQSRLKMKKEEAEFFRMLVWALVRPNPIFGRKRQNEVNELHAKRPQREEGREGEKMFCIQLMWHTTHGKRDHLEEQTFRQSPDPTL